jgi:6-phosphogluconolactonase
MADMPSGALPGETRVVDDVPGAFARLVIETAPRSIALSGGDLAEACYERLAQDGLDWSGIDVYFGDDRFVPVTNPDSNEGMARRVLLDSVRPRAIHGMARGDTAAVAADAYDSLLADAPPIELVHLGIGPDGHTASLFAGSAALDERTRLVVATGDDAHPHPRVTFTYPAIERSPFVVVTVAGAEKRDAVARIRRGDDLPGTRLRAGGTLLWLLDAAAAGESG